MSSNYQMYLKSGKELFRFPVLPEEIAVSDGSNNDSIRVCGVGEVTIIQDSDATVLEFETFFPETYFSGCDYKDIPKPNDAVNTILTMKNSKKPVRFTIAGGIGVSMYCTIEKFDRKEKGGDVGSIHYSIKLKEYKETVIRQLKVDASSCKAMISGSNSRTDPSSIPVTYTVKENDCLWNLAVKFYRNGFKYNTIYNANKSIIGDNPNNIYAGQVLVIPAA